MKKTFLSLFLTTLIIYALFLRTYIKITPLYAEDCVSNCSDLLDCSKKIADCQHAWDLMQQAKKPHEENLRKMEADINNFKARIKQIESELLIKEKEISEGEKKLIFQEDLLAKRVHQFYIKTHYNTPLVMIFSQKQASLFLREFAYQQAVTKKDKKIITEIVLNIKDLEERKNNLEKENEMLTSLKKETDRRAEDVRKLLAEAGAYLKKVEVSLSSLSARQQELLAQKSTFTTTVGEVPLADDPASRPDFNPGFSPAFAVFSFGAPHRKGMSQYGAYGRAQDGQNEEQILKAYYGDIRIEEKGDLPGEIDTVVGRLSFEDNYLKGIAEMPSSWDSNNLAALKAQAIAARSYAIVRGKPICVDEGCQVYSSSKAANPPDNWRRAVEETKGKVIVSNQSGQIISSWYASTAGGYTYSYGTNGHTTSGLWDTSCGNQGCWTGDAYEKKAGSPWFYKAWYKPRGGSGTRSHPWLNKDELTDIINSILLYQKDNGTLGHLGQTDKSNPDTWSKDKVRQELGNPINEVTNFSVSYSTGGYTQTVTVSTNQGDKSFDGDVFRQIYNLRAPGEIYIASALYNLEKK